MTIAPLSRRSPDRLATAARQTLPIRSNLLNRRRSVVWAKWLLPLLALLLLSSVALWPQISNGLNGRIAIHTDHFSADMQTGRLLNVRYHGVDARNHPYTVTAQQAEQVGPDRINLVAPKGDVLNDSGSWTYSEADKGVYMQHNGLMDMAGHVVIYRDTGITLTTSTATMDLKNGAASTDQPTHVEGPFGTLDSQGFSVVDKGNIIQFDGQSHLLLNGTHQ